jgi:hypothetical protein
MGRKTLTALEAVLHQNVKRLIDAHEDYQGKVGRVKERHSKVRLETLQNLYNGDGGCNVASLALIADALGVQPYQLLVRDLDVKSPQQVVSARQMRAIKDLTEERKE